MPLCPEFYFGQIFEAKHQPGTMAYSPELVHPGRASVQSGRDQERFANLPYTYTGIWWYASYPNHYAGDGSGPNVTIGELKLESRSRQLKTGQ
jgi:creatinine amidohydrolase